MLILQNVYALCYDVNFTYLQKKYYGGSENTIHCNIKYSVEN